MSRTGVLQADEKKTSEVEATAAYFALAIC